MHGIRAVNAYPQNFANNLASIIVRLTQHHFVFSSFFERDNGINFHSNLPSPSLPVCDRCHSYKNVHFKQKLNQKRKVVRTFTSALRQCLLVTRYIKYRTSRLLFVYFTIYQRQSSVISKEMRCYLYRCLNRFTVITLS